MATGGAKNKVNQMRRIHQKAAREVAELRSDLERLQAKETFLREQMLLHQASVLGSEPEYGDVQSNATKLSLTPDQLATLKKVLDAQKRVSFLSTSRVTTTVKEVEGLDEAAKPDVVRAGPEREGILKTLEVEGSIDELNFKIACDTNHTMANRGGEIVQVNLLEVDLFSEVLRKMLKSREALEPTHIGKTLSNLRFYQMLVKERNQTLVDLIEDIPDLSVNTDVEPVEIEFFPTREQRLRLNWGIVYDPKNHRVHFKVDVECSEDVVAYYSQNREVFPVLSGETVLTESEAVADFLQAF